MDERDSRQRAFVEDCRARFPDLTDPWLHMAEDGTRLWLTDGKDGPVLAETAMPVSEEATDDRTA